MCRCCYIKGASVDLSPSLLGRGKKKRTWNSQSCVSFRFRGQGEGYVLYFHGMLWIHLLWWLCDAKYNDGNWFIENGGVATRSFSCTIFHTGWERSSIFGPLSLFDERCWFLCNEHVQTSFVCVWIFFSHLYGIYLVPINCDSLDLDVDKDIVQWLHWLSFIWMKPTIILRHRSVNNVRHFIVLVEIVVKIVLSKCLELKLFW